MARRKHQGNILLSPMGGPNKYLLQDEFHDTLAAGAVNATLATPGPGTRVVVDTDGDALSVGSGVLDFANPNNAASDPGYWLGAVTWTTGRLLVLEITPAATNTILWVGWDYTGAGISETLRLEAAGAIKFVDNGSTKAAIGTYTAATHTFAFVAGGTKGSYYYFVVGGTYSQWTYLFKSSTFNASANIYPVLSTYSASKTHDFIRVPARLWLPTPLAYDSFTRANGALGTSETTGPDGQPSPARTWESGGSTWAIASNEAVNTPSLGGTLWDGPAGVFTAGTYAWVVYGTNTIANDTNQLKITYVDNSRGAYNQLRDIGDLTSDLTVGTYYQWDCDARVQATESVNLQVYEDGIVVTGPVVTEVLLTAKMMHFYAVHATNCFARVGNMDGTEIIWLDNMSLKAIGPAKDMMTDVEVSTADVVISVELDAIESGALAGIVMNLDDKDTPANYVLASHNGTNAMLVKFVAGTKSAVIDATATYAAGATMVVIKDGTSYSLFYNNAKIGATSTISDAGIVDNTLHGMFSTSGSNQLDNFLVFPRTGGNYPDLDQWSGVNP